MENEFRDRVAIVTGASSGIGRATASLLAAGGARVAVLARSAEKLDELCAQFPGRVIAVPGDAGESGTIERLFEVTRSQLGGCHLLVNNAGMVDVASVEATTSEGWDRVFAVNVRSQFQAVREATADMKSRGGAIVNVASISGVTGPQKFPGFVSYCASKGAIISMTEAMAVELEPLGIRINCVSPGSVDTPMWAGVSGGAPASMTASEVAETILFLLSDRSRPMNGQNLHVYAS